MCISLWLQVTTSVASLSLPRTISYRLWVHCTPTSSCEQSSLSRTPSLEWPPMPWPCPSYQRSLFTRQRFKSATWYLRPIWECPAPSKFWMTSRYIVVCHIPFCSLFSILERLWTKVLIMCLLVIAVDRSFLKLKLAAFIWLQDQNYFNPTSIIVPYRSIKQYCSIKQWRTILGNILEMQDCWNLSDVLDVFVSCRWFLQMKLLSKSSLLTLIPKNLALLCIQSHCTTHPLCGIAANWKPV